MGTTVITGETHDDKVSEVGNTGLAHFHLARHRAGVARSIEDDRLIFHKLRLFEGLGEVQFMPHLLIFDGFQLLFGVLYVVTHCLKFFNSSRDTCYLHVFVLFGGIGVFYH